MALLNNRLANLLHFGLRFGGLRNLGNRWWRCGKHHDNDERGGEAEEVVTTDETPTDAVVPANSDEEKTETETETETKTYES